MSAPEGLSRWMQSPGGNGPPHQESPDCRGAGCIRVRVLPEQQRDALRKQVARVEALLVAYKLIASDPELRYQARAVLTEVLERLTFALHPTHAPKESVTPITKAQPTHEFDPGYTGMSQGCNQLIEDADGHAVECGLPRSAHTQPEGEQP